MASDLVANWFGKTANAAQIISDFAAG
jgi:hypothetical protein